MMRRRDALKIGAAWAAKSAALLVIPHGGCTLAEEEASAGNVAAQIEVRIRRGLVAVALILENRSNEVLGVDRFKLYSSVVPQGLPLLRVCTYLPPADRVEKLVLCGTGDTIRVEVEIEDGVLYPAIVKCQAFYARLGDIRSGPISQLEGRWYGAGSRTVVLSGT